jgi:hypothetical protein
MRIFNHAIHLVRRHVLLIVLYLLNIALVAWTEDLLKLVYSVPASFAIYGVIKRDWENFFFAFTVLFYGVVTGPFGPLSVVALALFGGARYYHPSTEELKKMHNRPSESEDESRHYFFSDDGVLYRDGPPPRSPNDIWDIWDN